MDEFANAVAEFQEKMNAEVEHLTAERDLFKKENLAYKEALEQIVSQEFYTIPLDHAIRHIAKDALGW